MKKQFQQAFMISAVSAVFFACQIGFSSISRASSPVFVNLSTSDYKNIVNEISSTWSYTSVTGASSLGHLFGFELGLVAGGAKTPKIHDLVQQASPGTDIPELPFAGLFGAVSFPYGLTAEVEGTPEVTVSGVSAQSESLALKWTFTNLFTSPVDAAVKVFGSNSEAKFSGTVSGVFTTFDMTDGMLGAQIQVSKKLLFFEPYVTLGTLQARGKMDVSGSTSVYQTGAMSDTETVSGPILMVGADLNLAVLRLGLEAGSVLGDTRAAAKVSLYF